MHEGGPRVEWDLGRLHVAETCHANPAGLAARNFSRARPFDLLRADQVIE